MMAWIVFGTVVLILLALDLGVFNRKSHVPSTREAMFWTAGWCGLSLLFSVFVYYGYKNDWIDNPDDLSCGIATTKYLTGYIVELSLSLDNIFVIALIFKYFRIPEQYQHKILFWGILGAVVFRGLMIGVGVVLIHRFEWIMYVFAAILLYSAWRMWHSGDAPPSLEKNVAIRILRKFFPVTRQIQDGSFVLRKRGVTAITPLLLALVMVELTDVLFAFDSIPAIFGITTDPFLVFTSNIFAILGLRSLYFVLAALLNRFVYLRQALTVVLFFVGVKIALSQFVELPEWLSLAVILLAVGSGIYLSMRKSQKV